jgi:glycosyltransferase involved in cell wall biosynthesis
MNDKLRHRFQGSRCLNVLFPFTGDSIGGSYVSALALIQSARKDYGDRVNCLIGVHKDGVLTDWLSGHSVEFEMLHTDWTSLVKEEEASWWSFGRQWVRAIWRNWQWLRRQPAIDVVHVNDGRMVLTWAIPVRLARRSLVVHQRTIFPRSRLTSLIYRLSTRIIAVSEFARMSLPDYLQHKAVVVDEPIDAPYVSDSTRILSREKIERMLGQNVAGLSVILVLGSILRQKRQFLALEAVRLLLDRGADNVRLIIAGPAADANRSELLEKIDRLGLKRHAFYVGRVPVYDLLPGVNILLAAGVDEGFGRTPAEAMICKVPVIASNSGGHTGFVFPDETGWLFEEDSEESCAATIAKVIGLSEAERRRVLANASGMASKRFLPSRHAENVIEIYGKISG